MAYRQYTSCVQPGSFVNLSFTAIGVRNIIAMVLTGLFITFLVWAFIGGPGALLVAISLVLSAVIFLYWWLNGRLICLNEEPCVIGMVRSLSAADPLDKFGDDDFSMNVMLAPGPTALREDDKDMNRPLRPVSAYQDALQGKWVSPQDPILAIGRVYFDDLDDEDIRYVTALHCEFEGSGIRNLLIWFGIALALLVAALIVQVATSGLGWLVGLLVLLALALLGLGLKTGPFGGEQAPGAGHPTDIGEHLKDLRVGDIVVVKGEWVYDSLHRGWNEIHPIRDCCIIARHSDTGMDIGEPWPKGFETDAEIDALCKRWCSMLDDARDCEEGGSREDPANGWILHPLVDGCRKNIIT